MSVSLGVLVGVFLEWELRILLSPLIGLLPNYLAVLPNYLAVMISSMIGGYIAQRRGWLVGLIVSLIHAASMIGALIAIGNTTFAKTGVSIPMIDFFVCLKIFCAVLVGIVAGALGGNFRRYHVRHKGCVPPKDG